MTDEQEMTEQQQQLWERIEGVRPTMMTTIAADGATHSRPMWTQGDAFDGSLWFFASRQSALADELVHDPRVALSYAAPDKDLYVSVSGQAELVLDRVKAEEMWSVFAEAWFPDGVDDANLVLVRVDVEQARYWEDNKPKVLQFAEILLGALRDRPPRSGEEVHLSFEADAPGGRPTP